MAHSPGQLEHIANQTLVTIAVRGNKLHVFPKRRSEVVAYQVDPAAGNPALPTEIRWAVVGLGPGQKIVIKPKPGHEQTFAQPEYVISGGDNTACSGPLKIHVRPAYSVLWSYSVELMKGTTRLDYIDPDVEIREDP